VPSLTSINLGDFVWRGVEYGHFLNLLKTALNIVWAYCATARTRDKNADDVLLQENFFLLVTFGFV
jgi:hypothetical protein